MNSDTQNNPNDVKWLSMSEAADHTPYSAEYLSLLARKGKLVSKKINGAWYTTKIALDDYMHKQMLRAQVLGSSYAAPITPAVPASIPVVPQTSVAQAEPQVDPAIYDEATLKSLRSFHNDIRAYMEREGLPLPKEEEFVKSSELKLPAQDYSERTIAQEFLPSIPEKNVIADTLGAVRQETHDGIEQTLERVLDKKLGKGSFATSVASKLPVLPQKSWRTVTGSRALLVATLLLMVGLTTLPVPFVFSSFENAGSAIKKWATDANTVMGFRPGTHANEILLLDKSGNIAIRGSVETGGQLASSVAEGTAPIVVTSKTLVHNLNAEYLSGASSTDFTLAFVTKNGGVTTEDVQLEGAVEVGKTLLVKGATKLLSSLSIDGGLNVFGPAQFQDALNVLGPAHFEQLVTLDSNLSVGRNISVRGSIDAGGAIISDSVSTGGLSASDGLSALGPISLGSSNQVFTINSQNITLSRTGDLVIGGTASATALTLTGSATSTIAGPVIFNGSVQLNGAGALSALSVTGSTTLADLLVTSSTTLQNVTFVNATGSQATTTNLFASTFTSLLGRITSLVANDISVGALTATNSTTTAATSTNSFATTASSTNLYTTNGNIGFLTFGNATGTQATTTNLFSHIGTFDNVYVNNYQQNNGTFVINSTVPTGDVFSVLDNAITNGTLIHQTLTANAGNGQVSKGQIIDLTDNTTAGGGYSAFTVNASGTGNGSGLKTLLDLNPGVNKEIVFDATGALRPTTDVSQNTTSIGTPSFYFKNGYFDTLTANNIAGNVITGATASHTWTIGSSETGDVNEAVVFQRNSGSGNALLSWNASSGTLNDQRFLSVNYPFNAIYTVNDSSIATTTSLYSGLLTNNTTSGTQKLLSLTNTGTGTTEDGIYLNNTGTGLTALEIAGTWTTGILTNNNSINAGTGAITGGFATFANILATGSTTLQNFTAVNSTSTSATTTSLFASTASSTNLFYTTANGGNETLSGLLKASNLFATASTTLQNFTFVNATGSQATTTSLFSTNGTFTNLVSTNQIFTNATITNATTTNLFSSVASSTSLFASTASVNGSAFNVTSGGNVGIGITNPSAKLTVAGGDISVTGSTNGITFANSQSIRDGGVSGDLTLFTPTTAAKINLNTTNGNILLSPGTGSVGIGTTTPQGMLQVARDVSALPTSSIYGQIEATLTSSPTSRLSLGYSSTFDAGFLQAISGSTNKPLLLNPQGGSVGIGTTNPANRLEIVGAANQLRLRNSSTNGEASMMFDAGTNGAFQAGVDGPGGGWWVNDGSGYRLVVQKTTGNVGIGTTNPSFGLDVSGSTGGLRVRNGVLTLERSDQGNADGGIGATVTYTSNGTLDTSVGIRSAGGVYGSTSSGTNVNSLTLSNADNTLLAGSGVGNTAFKINTTGSHTNGNLLDVQNQNVSKFLITDAGNVGIGTTTPLSKLAISGGVTIGADYNVAAPTNSLLVEGSINIGSTSPRTGTLFSADTATSTGPGTISVTASSASVTGVGTDFTTRFAVGDTITANGETHYVAAITNDTTMNTGDVWTNTASGVTYQSPGATKWVLYQNGTLSYGGAATNNGSIRPIEINRAYSNISARNTFGAVIAPTISNTLFSNSAGLVGISLTPSIASTNTQTVASLTGLSLTANSNGSTTVPTITGVNSAVTASGSTTATTIIGGQFAATTNSGSLTTNLYGLQVSGVSGGGIITNAAGLAVANVAVGTNHTQLLLGGTSLPTGNFGIYNSNTDNNYFAGKIGLGTTTPSRKLTVQSTADDLSDGIMILASDYATNSGYLLFNRNSGNSTYATIQSGDNNAGRSLALNPSGGNVGVGTTNPDSKLTVNTTADGSNFLHFTTNANNRLTFSSDGSGNAHEVAQLDLRLGAGGTSNLATLTSGGIFGIGYTSDQGGAQKLQVNSGAYFNGAVGIAVTNPQATLQVGGAFTEINGYASSNTGTIRVVDNSNQAHVSIANGGNAAGNAPQLDFFRSEGTAASPARINAGDYVGIINFGGRDTLAQYVSSAQIIGIADGTFTDGNSDQTALTFWTKPNSAALAERLRITSAGNVGIGTTTPDTKLDVIGDFKVQEGITGGGRDLFYVIPASHTLGYSEASLNAQSVGISLYANTQSSNQTGNNQAGIGAHTLFAQTAGLVTGATDMAFGTNNLERLRITAGGNVGIGVTNPGVALEVKGAVNPVIFRNSTTQSKLTEFGFNGNDVGNKYAIGFTENSFNSSATTTSGFVDYAASYFGLATNAYYSEGNSGATSVTTISTSTPSWALGFNTINNDNFTIRRAGPTGSPSTDPVFSTLLTVNSSGNVGIGSGLTNPTEKLHVFQGNIFASGIQEPTSLVGTPASGGSLASGTYYYIVTAIDATGETSYGNGLSGSGSGAVTLSGSNHTVNLTWSAVTGATGYKIYRSTAFGTVAGGNNFTQYSPGNVTSFSDTGAAGSAVNPPSYTTASGLLKSNIGLDIKSDNGTQLIKTQAPTHSSYYNFPAVSILGAYFQFTTGGVDGGNNSSLLTYQNTAFSGSDSTLYSDFTFRGFYNDVGNIEINPRISRFYIMDSGATIRTDLNAGTADGPSAVAYVLDTQTSLASSTARLLAVRNQGSEKLTILASGNVGIGTTNPGSLLEVNGTITTTQSSNSLFNASNIGNNQGYFHIGSTPTDVYIGQASTAGANPFSGTAILNSATFFGNKDNKPLQFISGSTPRITVDTSGNIGIGTTTPATKLQISTNTLGLGVDVTNAIGMRWADFTTTNRANTYAYFEAQPADFNIVSGLSNGSISLMPNGTGGVGVGTTTPLGVLSVRTNSTSPVVYLDNSLSGGTSYSLSPFVTGVSNSGFQIKDETNNVQRLVISSSGNIGIGTTTPAVKLDVNGSITIEGSNDLNLPGSNFGITNGTSRFLSVASGANPNVVINASGGNLGIGSSTPSMKLTEDYGTLPSNNIGDYGQSIYGNAAGNVGYIGQQFYLANTSGDVNTYIRNARTSGSTFVGLEIGSAGPNGIRFATAAAGSAPVEAMRIDNAGNVGIGITNPSSILHVKGSTNIISDISNGGISFRDGSNHEEYIIQLTNSNADLRFRDQTGAGLTAMTIKSGGNVGIGITNPSTPLAVSGIAAASTGFQFSSNLHGSAPTCSSTNRGLMIAGSISSDDVPFFCSSGTGGFVWNLIGSPSGSATTPDLAEYVPVQDTSISGGEIVALSDVPNLSGTKPYDTFYAERASTSNQQKILGIVSTNPGYILNRPVVKSDDLSVVERGPDTTYLKPLALAGRVPVKVTTEAGEVHAGDYVTLSDTVAGAAMKVTHAGYVLGQALDNYDPSTGEVLVLVGKSYYTDGISIEDLKSRVDHIESDLADATSSIAMLQSVASSTTMRLNALEARVLALENGSTSATSTGLTFDATTTNPVVSGVLAVLGSTIADGITHFKDVVVAALTVDKVTVGSQTNRTGITLYDSSTGSPYCFRVVNGASVTLPGECSNVIDMTQASSGNTGSTATSTSDTSTSTPPTDTASSTPPTDIASSTPTMADSGTATSTTP